MITKPTISIIIPTYNRAYCLSECLSSIISQTYKDWELIVVDDGSTDNTEEIIQPFMQEGIIYIKQQNQGVSSARNTGLSRARGQYIAFCDSDDRWIKNKLAIQMQYFSSNKDMILNYTEEIWIRNGIRVNQCKQHAKLSGWIFEKCLDLCIVSPSSVMMHQSFFDKVGVFDTTLPACEDYDLWLRGAIYFPYYFITTPLIIKTGGHQDQLSRKYWGMDRFRIEAIINCLHNSDLTQYNRIMALKKLHEKCQVLMQGAKKRNNQEVIEYYAKIIEEYPLINV